MLAFTHFSRLYSSCHKNIIYISKSANPYKNLAFENWLYENTDFSKNECIFIWRNEPTVVIGKHQNPWLECDPTYLNNNNIHLARRYSGGGAVFHDMGNINITFCTSKNLYNRKKNLQIIVDALHSQWSCLNLLINERDDILLNGQYKISGTAAKIGRVNAYHHCTLLFQSDPHSISKALSPALQGIKSNATQSLRSPVISLSDIFPDISFEELSESISNMYLTSKEGLKKSAVFVDTNDTLFPGISKEIELLQTYDWVFGKTPQFSITHQYESVAHGFLQFIVSIKSGKIANISIKSDNESKDNNDLQCILNQLNGKRLLHTELFDIINTMMKLNSQNSYLNFTLKSLLSGLLPNKIS